MGEFLPRRIRLVGGRLLFAALLTLSFPGCSTEATLDAKKVWSKVDFINTRDFSVGGDGTLEIQGYGFIPGPVKVSIDGNDCPLLGLQTSTKITCATPAIPGVALRTLKVKIGNTEHTYPQKLRFHLVLGQETLRDRRKLGMRTGFLNPYAMSAGGGKLAVADSGNHRVLLWNSIPTDTLTPPDLVLGQTGMDSADQQTPTGLTSASTMTNPLGVFTDGTRVIVADSNNHRVLVWTNFPTRNGQPADLVLGQPDFASRIANNGGVSASSLSGPRGVSFDGTRIAVADFNNNRVLVWNSMPASPGAPASFVLGQGSFATVTANTGPNTAPCGGALGRNLCSMSQPWGIELTPSRLYVADSANHRVLVWSAAPTTTLEPATFVIGQPNVSSGTANNGLVGCDGSAGRNSCSLSLPTAVRETGGLLTIADRGNHRVLQYGPIPSANTPAATVVLGQSSFTNATDAYPSATAATLRSPSDVASGGGRLLVTDNANSRISGWSGAPTTGANADLFLGQFYPDHININYHRLVSSRLDLNDAHGVVMRGGRLFVMDRSNNRLLIWNSIPTRNNQRPDVVLGQPNLLTNKINNGTSSLACGGVAGVNACSLHSSIGIASDGTRLIVSDRHNNRVLIWNTIPTVSYTPADLVLGQPDFFSFTANNGPNTAPCGGTLGRNACSLNSPLGVDTDGTRLVVADQSNARVLIWSTFPTTNQQPADLVLGQTAFNGGTANGGPATAPCGGVAGLNQCSLSNPYHAAFLDNKLLIADASNSRILIYNSIPTTSTTPADVVLGQPAFNVNTTNNGGVSDRSLASGVMGLEFISGRLYAADRANNRLLFWNGIPSVSHTPAAGVLGQPDFLSSQRGMDFYSTISTVDEPLYVSGENGVIAVSEHRGNRVVLRPLDPGAADY